jgi:hypothetical protein
MKIRIAIVFLVLLMVGLFWGLKLGLSSDPNLNFAWAIVSGGVAGVVVSFLIIRSVNRVLGLSN